VFQKENSKNKQKKHATHQSRAFTLLIEMRIQAGYVPYIFSLYNISLYLAKQVYHRSNIEQKLKCFSS
jgi:hypothetical protein